MTSTKDEEGSGSDAEGWVDGPESDCGEKEYADPSGGPLTELVMACEVGESARVPGLLESLFETGVSVDTLVGDGDSALHTACLYGHAECVKLLLNAGANPCLLDDNGGTPLHDAAAGGFKHIVESLLAVSAETGMHKVQDNDGDSPLHNAARGMHDAIVTMLLDAGADPKAVNAAQQTPADCCEKNSALGVLLARAADATAE